MIRAIVGDDPAQSAIAAALFRRATLIAIPLPCLCEVSWVLRRVYGFHAEEIAVAMRALLNTASVVTHDSAARASLVLFGAGADFAGGVIAFDGEELGAEVFVSFHRKAVTKLAGPGRPARLAEDC